ncbi:MAG TPA: hypothetical protein VN729_04610 [Ktedonobacteraceae bacterium]|nr:hypothetical protein [Ktedonobacteraceae bacterium]
MKENAYCAGFFDEIDREIFGILAIKLIGYHEKYKGDDMPNTLLLAFSRWLEKEAPHLASHRNMV